MERRRNKISRNTFKDSLQVIKSLEIFIRSLFVSSKKNNIIKPTVQQEYYFHVRKIILDILSSFKVVTKQYPSTKKKQIQKNYTFISHKRFVLRPLLYSKENGCSFHKLVYVKILQILWNPEQWLILSMGRTEFVT